MDIRTPQFAQDPPPHAAGVRPRQPYESPAVICYETPAIVYEARLEVRAGTPVSLFPNLLDPLGLDQK